MSLSTSPFVSFILVHVSSWHKAGKHVSLDYAILAYLINSPKPYFIGNLSKLTSKTKISHFTKLSILFYFSGKTCFVRNGALGSMWREGIYIYIYISSPFSNTNVYNWYLTEVMIFSCSKSLLLFKILMYFLPAKELCNSVLDKERIFLAATTWTANFNSPVF